MVFCIKYRRSLLIVEERCNYLKQIFQEIAEQYWFEMEEMGSDGDQVHLFVGAAPKYAPSRVMQILKSISARQMFIRFPDIRQQLWGGEFWSNGGYIGTVGDGLNTEIVKRYIQEQGSEEEKARAQQMKFFYFRYPAACCGWVIHFGHLTGSFRLRPHPETKPHNIT